MLRTKAPKPIPRLVGIALLSSCVLISTCWAQSSDNLKKCYESVPNNPDLALRNCTAAIQSGKLSRENLAIAFSSRGSAYGKKGDLDRAIQDYDQYIRLDPNDAVGFINRGSAYGKKGD